MKERQCIGCAKDSGGACFDGRAYPFDVTRCIGFKPIDPKVDQDSALSRQVGGSHYKDYVIQPYEFFVKNKITHHKAAIIRRILRYDHPTGKGLEDLDKCSHEIELIKEIEGW